jgi:hypothetical protein
LRICRFITQVALAGLASEAPGKRGLQGKRGRLGHNKPLESVGAGETHRSLESVD